MSQAIVDPGELRRFAQSLKRFQAELQNNLAVLHGQMVSLGDTWRDQEHLKFVQEFEQTTQMLERFIEAMNQHVPYLQRKAERIEDYLQQK
jgi:WXG100 family type VII secretion target